MKAVRAHKTRMRPTVAGAIVIPITVACLAASLVVGGAATLLAAAAISLLGVSLLTSWLHLRGLVLEPINPLEQTVGVGFALRVRARSSARILPACAVTMRATTGAGKYGILPFLAPGDHTEVELPHRLQKRGLTESISIRAASAFPFGLVRCERNFEVPTYALGLPKPIAPEDVCRLPSFALDGTQQLVARASGDDELWAPRDWREGESLRRVHWKLSARRDRLVVSEFRSHEDGPLEVVLATRVPTLTTGGRHHSFERAVSITAAICERALRDRRAVNLRLLDSPHSPTELLRGRVGRAAALRALALVDPTHGDPVESASKEAKLAVANGLALACVLATGHGKKDAEPALRSSIYWIDVDAPVATRRARAAGATQ